LHILHIKIMIAYVAYSCIFCAYFFERFASFRILARISRRLHGLGGHRDVTVTRTPVSVTVTSDDNLKPESGMRAAAAVSHGHRDGHGTSEENQTVYIPREIVMMLT
jgi:hypothetical protein